MGINEPVGHEQQIKFVTRGGHDHDGVNSTPVKIGRAAIKPEHLDGSVLAMLQNLLNTSGIPGLSLSPVPDLGFTTTTVAAGSSVTGIVPWVALCFVRWVRIVMSQDTSCDITFYHKPTFADEDREFRAVNCSNKFLWEGLWAHFDETGGKNIYYKITNTGNTSASFSIELKAGTAIANDLVQAVTSLSDGTNVTNGDVKLLAGSGVSINYDASQNAYLFSSIPAGVLNINRFGLAPVKPKNFASSSTLTNAVSTLYRGYDSVGDWVGFGSGYQWVQAEYDTQFLLGAVCYKPHYNNDFDIYPQCKIDVSANGTSWTTIFGPETVWGTQTGTWVYTINSNIYVKYIRVYMQGRTYDNGCYFNKLIAFKLVNKV
jgi:hypothetical protein